MLQMITLPEWLPSWVPLVVLVLASLWALSLLFMPFSVFGVKSRLEMIEARLDEIQNEIRHVALRLPAGGAASGPDYDDVYPPRMQEPRAERTMSRPPIPPARHELYNAPDQDMPGVPPLEDRAPPPPNARPARRPEPPVARPPRSEPRLDWRR
jgi:hypothetical protein